MRTPSSADRSSRAFPVTRWSVVVEARDESTGDAAAALEDLCRTYWMPLYAAVRRSGHDPEDAKDLTQEFFARFLEKHWLHAADPEKGRFRTFLMVTLKRVYYVPEKKTYYVQYDLAGSSGPRTYYGPITGERAARLTLLLAGATPANAAAPAEHGGDALEGVRVRRRPDKKTDGRLPRGKDHRTCQHEWQQGVSCAVPVSSGQVVLVRKGEVYGAFVLTSQSSTPEAARFIWRYGTDSAGGFNTGDPGVTSSIDPKPTEKPHGAPVIRFGPFEITWSGGPNGAGWIYYAKTPGDKLAADDLAICVTDERSMNNLRPRDKKWQYRRSPVDDMQAESNNKASGNNGRSRPTVFLEEQPNK